MPLDRAFQNEILEYLETRYPSEVSLEDIPHSDRVDLQAQLYYLKEHGLLDGVVAEATFDRPEILMTARISADGLDFLQDDGGISAIKRTFTVKFDAENIRSLFVDGLNLSNIPDEEKHSLIDRIRSFSADTLRELLVQVSVEGLKRPETLSLLISLVDKFK